MITLRIEHMVADVFDDAMHTVRTVLDAKAIFVVRKYLGNTVLISLDSEIKSSIEKQLLEYDFRRTNQQDL
jgi:hypothetical protein